MTGTALITRPRGAVFELEFDALDAGAAAFAAASKSDATRRAYAADWSDFSAWCQGQGAEPLPATTRTIGRYLTHLARFGRSVATIGRRAAAIASVHRAAGHDNPCAREEVRLILAGIRKSLGKPPKKKKALTVDILAQVLRKIRGASSTAVRDRALILLAFGAALRRSEIVALAVEDLDFGRRGLMITLRKSKSDQEGEGRKIAVPNGKLKIPAAVQAWLSEADIGEGYVFPAAERGQAIANGHLSETHFARIIKARVKAAGLDEADFSGHSPRRGFATTSGDEGEDLRRIARHMRHAKLETTMGYMEDGELFRDNAGKSFL